MTTEPGRDAELSECGITRKYADEYATGTLEKGDKKYIPLIEEHARECDDCSELIRNCRQIGELFKGDVRRRIREN